MTTTNELYQAALAQIGPEQGWGTSQHTFANGEVLFCGVNKVAGRSITVGHYRTTYHLKATNAEYSKRISRAKVVELLKAEAK